MRKNTVISSIRAQISSFILLVLVLATVLPYNLLHDHNENDADTKEAYSLLDDHRSCDHELHLAEEQEICLLCHFVFSPVYKSNTPNLLGELNPSLLISKSGEYTNEYELQSIHNVLNKGSPTC